MKIIHLFIAGLVLSTLTACGIGVSRSGIPYVKPYGQRMTMTSVWLSPDGRYVRVNYEDRTQKRPYGAALLEWRTGALSKLGSSQKLDWPLPTMQPGTNKMIFPTFHHFRGGMALLDKDTPTEMLYKQEPDPSAVILDSKNVFSRGASNIHFIAYDEIIFTAQGPENPQLQQQIRAMGIRPDFSVLPYRMKLGGSPQLFMPIIEQKLRAAQQQLGAMGSKNASLLARDGLSLMITQMSASADGKKIVYIGASGATAPKTGWASYEIFMYENGQIRPLTNLGSHLNTLNISADGSTVAFGADSTRTNSWDLHILDLTTMQLYKMDLAKRMDANPAFAPAEK